MESGGVVQEDNFTKETLDGNTMKSAPSELIDEHVREIVLKMNYGVIIPLVILFGLLSNAMNVIVFLKMGFEKSVNISLLSLAISDFLSLLFLQGAGFSLSPFTKHNLGAPAYLEYSYEILITMHACFNKVTGLITAYVAFERCICVIKPLKVKAFITHGRTVGAMVLIFVTTVAFSLPSAFTAYLVWVFDRSRNVTRVFVGWVDNWMEMLQVYYIYHNITTVASFSVTALSTFVLVRAIKTKQEWRRGVSKTAEKPSALDKRDRRVVVTVTIISAISVFTAAPGLFMFITTMIDSRFDSGGALENTYFFFSSFSLVCSAINSSFNVFVYLTMNTNFRATCVSLFKRHGKPMATQAR